MTSTTIEEDYYVILGITKTATGEEIKKAYRKQSLLVHPDRNKEPGATKKFQELAQAYEILSDPKKKELYDRFGKAALREQQHQGMDAETLFAQMFPGGFGDLFSHMFQNNTQQQRKQRKRMPDVTQPMPVSLKDLYCGRQIRLAITRTVICKRCSGFGTKTKEPGESCKRCKGVGLVTVARQINIMIIQQSQIVCPDCSGAGDIIEQGQQCEDCQAKRVEKEKKVIEIMIEPGMSVGDHIVLEHMSDEAPNMEAGHIIFVLVPKASEGEKEFRRSSSDLEMTLEISLAEALLGFHRDILHMDQRILHIHSRSILQTGDRLLLKGEGMPLRNETRKGDLYILCSVKMPKELTEEQRSSLASLFSYPLEKKENHILVTKV